MSQHTTHSFWQRELGQGRGKMLCLMDDRRVHHELFQPLQWICRNSGSAVLRFCRIVLWVLIKFDMPEFDAAAPEVSP